MHRNQSYQRNLKPMSLDLIPCISDHSRCFDCCLCYGKTTIYFTIGVQCSPGCCSSCQRCTHISWIPWQYIAIFRNCPIYSCRLHWCIASIRSSRFSIYCCFTLCCGIQSICFASMNITIWDIVCLLIGHHMIFKESSILRIIHWFFLSIKSF